MQTIGGLAKETGRLSSALWLNVLVNLPPPDLGRVAAVSQAFKQLAESETIWRVQLQRHYAVGRSGHPTYREAFRVRWTWEKRLWNGVDPLRLSSRLLRVTAMDLAGRINKPLLVVGCDDGKLHIWNLSECGADQQPTSTLEGHTDRILDLKLFLRDGMPCCVTSSADHSVKVWDLSSAKLAADFKDHTDTIVGLELVEQEGIQYAITASNDKTIRVYDLMQFACINVFEEKEPVHHLTTLFVNRSIQIISMAMTKQDLRFEIDALFSFRDLQGRLCSSFTAGLHHDAISSRMMAYTDGESNIYVCIHGRYHTLRSNVGQYVSLSGLLPRNWKCLTPVNNRGHMLGVFRREYYGLDLVAYITSPNQIPSEAVSYECRFKISELIVHSMLGKRRIFCYGYAPHERHDTFRSPSRLPTYELIELGSRGHSIESPAREFFPRQGFTIGMYTKTSCLAVRRFDGWTVIAAANHRGHVAVYLAPEFQAISRQWQQIAMFVAGVTRPIREAADLAVARGLRGDEQAS